MRSTLLAGAGLSVFGRSTAEAKAPAAVETAALKLGLVTYNLGKDWDVPAIIENCAKTGFQGVELRTGHAHKVEPDLSADGRREVRARFAASPVRLLQLGSTCEFHSTDASVVEKNIEQCKLFIQLAADVGAAAVKVRPNGLQTRAGVPEARTLEQIGRSLGRLGLAASGHGIEIRLEVHGTDTSRLERIQRIIEIANHPQVTVNWNSNQTDLEGGTLEENFNRVSPKIRHVHMRDLFLQEYPWKELFRLLKGINFGGYCCAEVPESSDPLRVMRYYRALFLEYQS